MKPFKANFLNGVILIAMGLMGYFLSDNPSKTAFIPVAFGALFLLATPGLRKENKVIAHVVVLFTLLVIIMLVMPLMGALERDNMMSVIRLCIMIVAGIFAMVSFIQSFRAARKARENAA